MSAELQDLKQRRSALLGAAVSALEAALPAGAPARRGAGRMVWEVLADHLRVSDVRGALRAIASAPGGELAPTTAGNVSMCSAESSALMVVNFLAPFVSRGELFGLSDGTLAFEREFRVQGVRARFGPTLDAVYESAAGSVAIEAKTAEPWRGEPKVEISTQYDVPAARVSPSTLETLTGLRDRAIVYECLDAAQLIKHLLGLNDAIRLGRLREPGRLVLMYWRPTVTGEHGDLFDHLAAELADFSSRLTDQPVSVSGIATNDLLAQWYSDTSPAWLKEHADRLRARYDVSLGEDAGPNG